jgi:hypothetical protein
MHQYLELRSPRIVYTACLPEFFIDRVPSRFVLNPLHAASVIGLAIYTKMFFADLQRPWKAALETESES